MFGGAFNRAPFNRVMNIETLFSVTFEPSTEMDARLNIEMPMSVIFEPTTEFSAEVTREIMFGAVIESATEMIALLTRDLHFATSIETISELSVTITHSHVDQLTFTGAFNPGDRIVIDTKKKTITLNGQNVLHLMGGDFFDLIYGTNKIMYKDGEAARNVLTRITHRDKYLY